MYLGLLHIKKDKVICEFEFWKNLKHLQSELASFQNRPTDEVIKEIAEGVSGVPKNNIHLS
jgi:hypothetical protein